MQPPKGKEWLYIAGGLGILIGAYLVGSGLQKSASSNEQGSLSDAIGTGIEVVGLGALAILVSIAVAI